MAPRMVQMTSRYFVASDRLQAIISPQVSGACGRHDPGQRHAERALRLGSRHAQDEDADADDDEGGERADRYEVGQDIERVITAASKDREAAHDRRAAMGRAKSGMHFREGRRQKAVARHRIEHARLAVETETKVTDASPTSAPRLTGITSHLICGILPSANETGLGTSSVRQSVMPVSTRAIRM